MQGSYADDLNICTPVDFAEEISAGTTNIFENDGFRWNKVTLSLGPVRRDDEDLVDDDEFHFGFRILAVTMS